LASLIRNLKSQYVENQNPNLLGQIQSIRKRIIQVRNMQACGIMGFLLCVISMWLLYNSQHVLAGYAFGLSLLLLMISLLGVMNTADFHYDQKKKIVYLPTFYKKSVIAYKLH